MALACDLIVAAEDATFGLTEVTWGLVPPEGGIVRLPERIPRNIALELLLTGDRLTADRAERSAWSTTSPNPARRSTGPWNWPPTSRTTPRCP